MTDIKLVTPKVYLVGRQKLDDPAIQNFLADNEQTALWMDPLEGEAHSDAELLIETAGRVCYMSFGKPRPGGNKAYLDRILESAHGSVIEHSVWNFIVTGISRSLSHELVRHRAGWSYSQLSQRYVDESVAEYVCPDVIHNDPELTNLWLNCIGYQHDTYVQLAEKLYQKITRAAHEQYINGEFLGEERRLEYEEWLKTVDQDMRTQFRKESRQAARSVLPNATETKIFLTVNGRALRSTIELRCSRFADVEIRKLFGMIWEIMKDEAPHIFGDYIKIDLPDGTFEVATEHQKV